MTRPVIGITASLDPGVRIRKGRTYLYLKRGYGDALMRCGAAPVIVSPEVVPEACTEALDGLVISGGDLLPHSWQGPAPYDPAELECEERITWERELIDCFSAAGKPILGICYGMQLLNLHFGGTLVDLPSAPGDLDHGGRGEARLHGIEVFRPPKTLRQLPHRVRVMSSHCQAVDRVADGFLVGARAEDGVIEAIERGSLWGVEWHPESDETGPGVYGELVRQALGRANS